MTTQYTTTCNLANYYGSVDFSSERASARKHVTKAFGNMNNSGLGSSPLQYASNVLGPFRTSFNSGDVISTYHTSRGSGATNSIYGIEANQVNGNNLSRLNPVADGVSRNGSAMYSGNTKFVHDGSDYTHFKKLQAMNRNYSDYNYGGANNNQAQSAIRWVRR